MNWFDLPASRGEESLETVARGSSGRIERIVSWGQHSPADAWYDSPDDEFVLLLKGRAVLEWADGTQQSLRAGDHLVIPKHCRHRVAFTSTNPPALWLTVYGSWEDAPEAPELPCPSR